jgi:hypothetical protein
VSDLTVRGARTLSTLCQLVSTGDASGACYDSCCVWLPVQQERMEQVMGVRLDVGGGVAKPKPAVSALFAQSTTALIMNEARRWVSVVCSGQCALH